ncbi:hypothetical protein DPEC_G00053510 [Dallia pectoralis]|uniref:Uncharacterized protein n=1 Tax=Dallia pectoralis TaxID=75939 RepID=A0ACC2H5M7_DALPE|nr:hypothetical protein DPEC_G00053510 [Dallia pectoralis]
MSFSSGRRSRNFSLSSEKYLVNQMNKSVTGSSYGQPLLSECLGTDHYLRETRRSVDIEAESCQQVVGDTTIVPQDDDIEKSFRVNQDGSMTVEMKSPGNNMEANESTKCLSDEKINHRNHHSQKAAMGVSFTLDKGGGDSGDAGSLKADPDQWALTPGLRQVKKKQGSVESVTTVTESGVQKSSLGTLFYTEHNEDGETTEGYCVCHQSSKSSSRIAHVPPIPKPRKSRATGLGRARRTGSYSNLHSPSIAEVMQIQTNDNSRLITDKVMHIHERRQSIYNNYYVNALGAGDSQQQ